MKAFLLLCLVLPVFSEPANSRGRACTSTNIADHPHQLSLRVSGSHICSASLVSSTKAVTAAHCGGGAIYAYSILAGATSRTETSCSTCVLRSLNSFIRHSGFINNGNQGYPNDLGVIQFNSIELNTNIQPIIMADPEDGDYAGQSCVISGWGQECGGSTQPIVLQQGTKQVITNTECANYWSAEQIRESNVCVLPTGGPCGEDSAAPLVCNSKLVGIASWRQAQCNPAYPSVYTRISYYKYWIIIS